MTRPGERLEKLLADRGISKTDFGEDLKRVGGYRTRDPYRFVQFWVKGRGFDDSKRNQLVAAQVLGVPEDYFSKDDPSGSDAKPDNALIVLNQSVFMDGLRRYLDTVAPSDVPADELDMLVKAQEFFGDDPGLAQWVMFHQVAKAVCAAKREHVATPPSTHRATRR